MQGIAAIAQRMAQIQALVAPPTVVGRRRRRLGVARRPRHVVRRRRSAERGRAHRAATRRRGRRAAGAAARLNGDGVPAELAAYGNGKIPASALAGGRRHGAPAVGARRAVARPRLISAAAADGVTVGITDSYRSYEAQVDVAQRKGLYSQGGLAAVPGHAATTAGGWPSTSTLDATAQAWMRAHGGRARLRRGHPARAVALGLPRRDAPDSLSAARPLSIRGCPADRGCGAMEGPRTGPGGGTSRRRTR